MLAVESWCIQDSGWRSTGLAAMIHRVVRISRSRLPVSGYSALFGGVCWPCCCDAPNSRVASAFRLSTRLTTPSGPLTVASAADHLGLTGAIGVALSDLRPAGVARFNGDRIDVVSEGDFVSAGSSIKVLRSEGNRVTVREVASAQDSTRYAVVDGTASTHEIAESTDTGANSHTAARCGCERAVMDVHDILAARSIFSSSSCLVHPLGLRYRR